MREAIPNMALKITKAPLEHRQTHSNAIAALQRELVLFEEMAAEHGVISGFSGSSPFMESPGERVFFGTMEEHKISWISSRTA